jgi:signal recognition particle subunit SRP54
MFDSLSQKLQNAFRNLRGLGKISESNVGDCLARSPHGAAGGGCQFQGGPRFHRAGQNQGLGQEVVQSIQPGQQIIKIIHDELVDLARLANAGLALSGNPSCI